MRIRRLHAADLRVAMISMHTSPLDQPGTGDAGGMNVYVAQTARRLAEAGVAVDVFTRATSPDQPQVVPMWHGVDVHHLPAGPFSGLRKEDLPGQVCPFAAALLRAAAELPEGHYDLVHSHYWLSGQAGWLAAERWAIPHVSAMHTLAKVKNDHVTEQDEPEPLLRVVGEEQVVSASDHLIANTAAEHRELIERYGAEAAKVSVVHPGVDLGTFSPGARRAARRRAGLPADKDLVLFVGRIQPLKAPDLLLRATAALLGEQPHRRDHLQVVVCGGLSGAGLARPDELHKLAAELGIADIVSFLPPVTPPQLADLYRSADIVTVPSHSESFGLVALEAQACGTPVLAADVGGLRTAVADGQSGLLLPDHAPHTWATAIRRLLEDRKLAGRLGRGAVRHAQAFSWSATAAGTLAVYEQALSSRRSAQLRAVN